MGPKKRENKPQPQKAAAAATPGKALKAPAAKPAGRSTTGYVILMAFVIVVMIGMVASFSFLIGMGLKVAGMLELLPAIMMMAASVMTLMTTIYKTNGMLFGFKDYDMVMSLPIKTSTVITSRLIILYLMNMMFCLIIMVPSAVMYAMLASAPVAFWPVFIICLLLTPLVPVVLATIVGSLISWAASHFKRKNGLNVVFTVIALLLWMLFCMNINNIADQFVLHGPQIMGMIGRIYPLVTFYTSAVAGLNMGAFAIFALISVGAFAAFVGVVSKFFVRMNASLTATRTTSNYKMQELKTTTPQKALYRKELRRFSSSPSYVMNTGIGLILMLILSVVAVVVGPEMLIGFVGFDSPELAGFLMARLSAVVPVGMGFFTVLICPSCSSVSLEGKSLWIVKSLPVSTRDVLMSKLKVNVMLVLVGTLVSATLVNIALRPAPLFGILIYVTPALYGLFSALFGLVLNLAHPNFNWNNELEVIKRGMPALAVSLVGMAITMVPAILALFLGPVVLYVATAALAVACPLLYRNIVTKGVAKFESFAA